VSGLKFVLGKLDLWHSFFPVGWDCSWLCQSLELELEGVAWTVWGEAKYTYQYIWFRDLPSDCRSIAFRSEKGTHIHLPQDEEQTEDTFAWRSFSLRATLPLVPLSDRLFQLAVESRMVGASTSPLLSDEFLCLCFLRYAKLVVLLGEYPGRTFSPCETLLQLLGWAERYVCMSSHWTRVSNTGIALSCDFSQISICDSGRI
jgi:hypothetical protein